MIRILQREQLLPAPPVEVWEFFSTPLNLAAITPEHMRFEIVGAAPERMFAGQMIEYRIGLLPGLTTRWLTEITHMREGEYFVDEQRIGPYRLWHHEHYFTRAPYDRGVIMRDRITYDVGWGWVGDLLHAVWIGRQLNAIFNYRAQRIAARFPGQAR